ncbi:MULTISPECIES: AmmeMemoRadiSam system protein B [Thalassospira]|uniref:MEMO1 family protein TH6_09745 n=1 Tax=Thalassospira profundimaris TaxID=502049 RepID=A0A367VDI6_9PROT|nr:MULTISPECIES: AmmeMemoRadiSam system protein B [Thalassospira]KZB73551.1 extradiol dioxygenase [Thalassospira sp. MCCC 1A01148]MBR9900794.1 AmmeMemoRadiSam system protein B [Rhodospirillales bacterium]RCK23288.1 dioxygenase [Thalassospira profundimaris]
MTIIRPPAVAGTFYPADADLLRSEIDGLMGAALQSGVAQQETATPKAIIVPHAGLMFSGSLAALGFATVRALKDTIKRIVIIGPAHRMAFQGIALARADQFATPLGNMRCDLPALQKALALPHVQMLDDAHTLEHGLEIELPFIQRLFGEDADIGIVPLLVSRCSPRQVHEVIEKLWGGPETLIVISSDLSHFHDYDTAKKMDNRTRAMIENFDAENIDTNDACGALPVAGMLMAARNRGMKIKTLGMRNSGDVTGDKSRVVGYGAWAVYDGKASGMGGDGEDDFTKTTETLIRTHGPAMLDLCRQSILHGMETGAPLQVSANEVGPALAAPGACFVTLKKAGQLRGCIGSIISHAPLATDLCENAFKAAFRDPRFAGLSRAEIGDDLELSISVLSPPHPFGFADEADFISKLTPFEDGIILSDGNRRGLFLPQVWDQLPDPKDFLAHLKRKAGLAMDHWSPNMRAERFITRGISSSNIRPSGFWDQQD